MMFTHESRTDMILTLGARKEWVGGYYETVIYFFLFFRGRKAPFEF